MIWTVAACAGAAACGALVATGRGSTLPPASGVLTARRLLRPLQRAVEKSRRAGQSSEAEAEVPEMLDILTLGLSAGLSFDASLALYADRATGPLGAELRAARSAWEVGEATRAEALEAAAERLRAPALARFAGTVSEALEFGLPLAETLQRQARALRDEQRRSVEEAVEKVPVKMLGPLAGLVVPAMLLAILGPLLAGVLTVV